MLANLKVEINPIASPYFNEIDLVYPGFSATIISDFSSYKRDEMKLMNGIPLYGKPYLPSYFGKDVVYDTPSACFDENVMHIHLLLPPDKFPAGRPQSRRTCRRDSPEKDTALIYTYGFDDARHSYSILGIFYPRAHEQARSSSNMNKLINAAREFKDRT